VAGFSGIRNFIAFVVSNVFFNIWWIVKEGDQVWPVIASELTYLRVFVIPFFGKMIEFSALKAWE